MQEKTDKQNIIINFESAADFLEWASRDSSPWKKSKGSHQHEWSAQWSGTRTYRGAYKLARYGWEKGVQLLREVRLDLPREFFRRLPAPQKKYGIAGSFPHPGRAAAGDPFSMAVFPSFPKEERSFVSIRHHFGGEADVSSERLICFGAALGSYIELLEMNNISVELLSFFEATSKGKNVSFHFPLKKSGEKISDAHLIYWLAHPSALRRITLAGLEKLNIESWFGDEYGYGRLVCLTPPRSTELVLGINDSASTFDLNLYKIRMNHLKVLGEETSLGKKIAALNLG